MVELHVPTPAAIRRPQETEGRSVVVAVDDIHSPSLPGLPAHGGGAANHTEQRLPVRMADRVGVKEHRVAGQELRDANLTDEVGEGSGTIHDWCELGAHGISSRFRDSVRIASRSAVT